MVEQVKYQIVRKAGKIEIRHYPRLVIARVGGVGDRGFNTLFQYISGNNRQKTNLPMTAPVISENIHMTAPVISDSRSLSFVLPGKYTLANAPVPLDERVRILEIPDRFVAALRFSGRWSETIFTRKSKELMDELAKSIFKTKGSVFVMRYSGPFTPWFLRRNEVAIEIEPAKDLAESG